MKRNHRGFTLIELLFVVTLIGIMVAIAVPSFAWFISGYRATGAVNDLLEAITLTRSEALKRGRRVTLMPNDANHNPSVTGSWANGWTVFVDLNNDQVMTLTGTTPDVLINQHDVLPSSITVSGSTDNLTAPFAGSNYFVFDGSGYAHNPQTNQTIVGGIVFLNRTGSATNYKTLCLAAFGRPRIISSTTAPSPCATG
jgi:type IV fimbrial biogenesis protein FimT